MYAPGMGDATGDAQRASAEARQTQLTRLIQSNQIGMAALQAQGVTGNMADLQAQTAKWQAERNALNAWLNGHELTATDRVILATGGYITDVVDAAGNLIDHLAGGVGDVTSKLLRPLLVPVLAVLAVVLFAGKSRK